MVDTHEKIDAVMPRIDEMVREGWSLWRKSTSCVTPAAGSDTKPTVIEAPLASSPAVAGKKGEPPSSLRSSERWRRKAAGVIVVESAMSSGVPVATMWPPRSPPSGPRSMIQSADLDHVQVVFDDDHRVAAIDQLVEHVQQLPDVVEVQPGRRFVQQVQRVAGVDAGQFGGQFDALGFTAGERGGRLPQAQVAQPDIACRLLQQSR